MLLALTGWALAAKPYDTLPPHALKHEVFVSSPCEEPATDEHDDPSCDAGALGHDHAWTCTGVLIDSDWVLTARHCLPLSRLSVGHDVMEPVSVHDLGEAVVFPRGDVALVPLVQPVELPLERTWDSDGEMPSGQLRAVGFGSPAPRAGKTGRKRGVHLKPLDAAWGCDPRRASVAGCTPGHELVAVGLGAKDTCNGDSGGPLFELYDGHWQVVGIVSRPLRNSMAVCGDGGIYTRVDILEDWIARTARRDR